MYTIYPIAEDVLEKIKEFEEENKNKNKTKICGLNYELYKQTHLENQKKYYMRHNKSVICKTCNKEYSSLYYKYKHFKNCPKNQMKDP